MFEALRLPLAIGLTIGLTMPPLGCGAHLYRAHDDQVASKAVTQVEVLDWGESFAADRAQRDALEQREAELSWRFGTTRRDAELVDVLNEPVGERSWARLEAAFVELGVCLLDEVDSGRACRGAGTDAERERARALLFDACSGSSCAWIDALGRLKLASARLRERLAAYDRGRALEGRSVFTATAAQCPLPTQVPSVLRDEAQRLEQACGDYDLALTGAAAALPEGAGLRTRIAQIQGLIAARDRYRRQLRTLVAELSPLNFERSERSDPGARRAWADELAAKVEAYDELQVEFGVELAGAGLGDYGDLGLEGTLRIATEHHEALVRVVALPLEIVEPPELPEGEAPAPEVEAEVDRTIVEELGRKLGPVFGQTWVELQRQQAQAERTTLLFSAEVERVQIDAMTRRLALANARVLLELGTVETELFALLRLRLRLRDDWIPAGRLSSPVHAELDELELERRVAAAELGQAENQRHSAAAKAPAANKRAELIEATQWVDEAQARVDAASDASMRLLAEHGAALCRRSGTVMQSWLREDACIEPIERLVELHSELLTVVVPRLESLQRGVARRVDEADLVRDEAGLKIRVTYIAASVTALQRFSAGGIEGRDLAAIVGAVVGVGLGTAIATGVHIP